MSNGRIDAGPGGELRPGEERVKLSWLFLMAWRDSRRNRSRLLLFISSIVLGITALVSTLSFGFNLRMAIDDQAKELVGADLVIRSPRPLAPEWPALLDSVPNRHSEECSFASMISFIKNGQSRLVQVQALDGDYPFYGVLGTTPAAAGMKFRTGRLALVDKTLLLRYGARVGDSIRIGEMNFAVAGSLDKAPGRNELSTTMAPPVYIPLRYLEEAGLSKRGSRITYRYYYQYPHADIQRLMKAIGPRLEKGDLDVETVESRKVRMSRAFGDLTQFLTLISFIALLLGCVGVASSVNIYIREKINNIAVLRCLGLKGRSAFLIYLIQVTGIGLIGSVAGAVLGVAIQQVLPAILKDILPLDTGFYISAPAILEGIAVGMIISLLFALLPLLSIRKISPLNVLRVSVEGVSTARDPLRWGVYIAIFGFVTFFSFLRIGSWGKALAFSLSLLITFLLLAGMAWLLMAVTRRLIPARWPYLWRQGFANLYRPNNQTLVLIVTIGLGTTFIGTLYFIQQFLIDQVSTTEKSNQGNMILFDVQTDQVPGLTDLAKQYDLRFLQDMPIVTMRLKEANGISEDQAVEDRGESGRGRGDGGARGESGPGGRNPVDTSRISRRWFETELRVTYRDSLLPSERLLSGQLGKRVHMAGDSIAAGETVSVSVDEEWARRLRVKVGDSVVFDVQGVPVATRVGSIRRVETNRLQQTFGILFPTGVLDRAPQFHVLVTRVSSPEVSARFQEAVVNHFSNVSVIDLRLILSVLDEVLGKIGFVIRFMAGFSMLTGIVVLIASVLISKFQRIQESVLLRTLGASRRQVRIITLLEYFFLGALAALTGLGLSLLFTQALARLVFESSITIHGWPVLVIFLFVCALTVGVGLYNSRGVLNRPPLEVLRNEG